MSKLRHQNAMRVVLGWILAYEHEPLEQAIERTIAACLDSFCELSFCFNRFFLISKLRDIQQVAQFLPLF